MLELFIALLGAQPQVGMATYYTYADYGGNPLYCSTPAIPLYYDEATAQKWPWIAVDVEWYKSGEIDCFDPVLVEEEDGTKRVFYALDAGPFGDYYIEDHPDLPIIVDMPEWFWHKKEMSQVVRVYH